MPRLALVVILRPALRTPQDRQAEHCTLGDAHFFAKGGDVGHVRRHRFACRRPPLAAIVLVIAIETAERARLDRAGNVAAGNGLGHASTMVTLNFVPAVHGINPLGDDARNSPSLIVTENGSHVYE